MKRIILIASTIMAATISTQCTGTKTDNPLLQEKWNTLHETAPFSKIKPEHFMPAVEAQIKGAKADIDKIVNNPEAPTFANTIEALEYNGMDLSRTLGVFFNLNSAETSEELQAIAMQMSPMLAEYGNDVSLNGKLFARVKAVYDKRATVNMNAEQKVLLDDTYKSFVRSGANLNEEQKTKFRQISNELAKLGVEFEQNTLAATNAFEMVVADEAQLSGLPEAVKEAALAEAKDRDKTGYVFTLQYPSYIPFMKYADSRELREKMWMARNTLCATGDSTDNQEIVKNLAHLRMEMAQLLGYKTYADYALEDRMAQSPVKVTALLDDLYNKSVKFAREDVEKIQKYANDKGLSGQMMPWDFSYYDDMYATERYSVNDEMTRPYFQLEKAEAAIFMLANKLYGISFVENKEIPVYHPDVKAFEVHDEDGSFLAVLYCDYFPRAGKRSGAWMNNFREAYIKDGVETRPIVILVNNFTKPTESKPSLLSADEFTTMLHEFGHGLHGIFGKGQYPSQTGTNVYRDFVELPSQIMENWATEKEYLDMFAVHYETGKKMPADLIEKLIAKKNHLAAYSNIRQIGFGLNDMAWHSITSPVTVSVEEFEKRSAGKANLLPSIDGAFQSTAFGHIFSGGYSAGYYSYKWAEVLEADAFNQFQKNGIFDKKTATSFRENILSKGGTKHPMELYIDFAGHEPTVEPLLKKMGLTN